MMRIDLNLLPPDKKTRIKNLTKLIFSKDLLQLTIISCCLVAIALSWSHQLLQESFTDLKESADSVSEGYFRYNQDIKQINNTIQEISLTGKGYLPITPKLTDFIKNLPNNIKLSSLVIDRSRKQLVISGTALTRSDLLAYQDTLKKIPWIDNVSTPASKLFQKTNISFEFTTSLKNFPDL